VSPPGPVVNAPRATHSCAGTRVHAATRPSLRPLTSRRVTVMPKLGRMPPRECGPVSAPSLCERSDHIRLRSAQPRRSRSSVVRRRAGGHPVLQQQLRGLWILDRPAKPVRSGILTLFWHCGYRQLSFRRLLRSACRQPGVNRFGRRFRCSKGSGNADSQQNRWNRGGGGRNRHSRHDSGCVPAHPPYRASSYLPLRAGWARAPGHSGAFEDQRPLSAQNSVNHPKGFL
jgi:hypothetical protein